MKLKSLAVILGISSSFLLSACSSDQSTGQDSGAVKQDAAHQSHSQQPVGDVRENTKSIETKPHFLADKPENIQSIYLAAAQNKKLLELIPCYCGCAESAGHKNNYDCFISQNKKDGSVVWDDHGTKCGVCLEIAAQSINDLQNGMTLKEIRNKIDNKYENGYAKPTATPQV